MGHSSKILYGSPNTQFVVFTVISLSFIIKMNFATYKPYILIIQQAKQFYKV